MSILMLLLLLLISTKSQIFNKPDGSAIQLFRQTLQTGVAEEEAVEVPQKWSCPIPFVFDASLAVPEQEILDAMNYMETMTGWTFVDRTTESDYIVFQNKTGACSSQYIGRHGGSQYINLDSACAVRGIIVHEIMHAIGAAHEHQRSDREQFVDVSEENIDPDGSHNFIVETIYNYGPYDYESVMHYDKWDFAEDISKMTITPLKDLSDTCYIGQRFELTQLDIKHLNDLIDGRYCSTLSRDECDPTDIIICGAETEINGLGLVFQEYELFGTFGGKNRYRSKVTWLGDYFSILWSNGWNVKWEGNNGTYLKATDTNLFTATWSQWNYAAGDYDVDPEISVANVDCGDSRNCYVSIQSAKDLKNSHSYDWPDPYVAMYGYYDGYWKGDYLFKTTTILNTAYPIWYEGHWMNPAAYDYLRFILYDYDPLDPDDYMGEAYLHLDTITCNANSLRILTLMYQYSPYSVAGSLTIRILCNCY